MRLRSRPVLFARLFADAVTTRPFLSALLEQRHLAGSVRLPEATPQPAPEVPAALPRAA